jgi:hypothetical protein
MVSVETVLLEFASGTAQLLVVLLSRSGQRPEAPHRRSGRDTLSAHTAARIRQWLLYGPATTEIDSHHFRGEHRLILDPT